MQSFQIQINGMQIQLGAPLPSSIYHFEIRLFFPTQVPLAQVLAIKQWFNQIIDKLDCEYVTYNNTLIPTNELKKF